MDTRNIALSGEEASRICYFKCLFSITEVMFYGIIAVAVLILVLILKVF